MDRLDADLIVIGAGVIGLAVARACAQAGRDVIVLEAEDLIAVKKENAHLKMLINSMMNA